MEFQIFDYVFYEELNRTSGLLDEKKIPYMMGELSLVFFLVTDGYEMDCIIYHKYGKIKSMRIIFRNLNKYLRKEMYQKILEEYQGHVLEGYGNSPSLSDVRSTYQGLCNMAFLIYFSPHEKEELKEEGRVMKQYDTKGIWNDITEIFLYKKFV